MAEQLENKIKDHFKLVFLKENLRDWGKTFKNFPRDITKENPCFSIMAVATALVYTGIVIYEPIIKPIINYFK